MARSRKVKYEEMDLSKLHHAEEKEHHKAERAMERDEKIHKKIEKKAGGKKGEKKMIKVMREFDRGELHSGSKKGPKVVSRKQAIAIGLSEARKAGAKIRKAKR